MQDYVSDISKDPPGSPAEFIQQLRNLRLWAGQPSLREMQHQAGRKKVGADAEVDILPRSTISTVLRGAKLPRADFIHAFITVCFHRRGYPEQEIAAVIDQWLSVWQDLFEPDTGSRDELVRRPGPELPGRLPPRQLPVEPGGFCGRNAELRLLDSVLAGGRGERVAVISGLAGVGKTALAVRWSHRVAGRFPHGQLFVSLRDSAMDAISPQQALGRLLSGLGVGELDIPSDPGDRANLYRSLVASQRLLLVLDGASNACQVRPLIATGPGCFTIVTSRNRMSGLMSTEGAFRLLLGALSPAAAHEVLTMAIGRERARAAGQDLPELARICAHLPLALRIAAVNLVDRPHLSVRDFICELRSNGMMSSLCVEAGGDVRTAFDTSYRTLDPQERSVFLQLAQLTETTFTTAACAALIGASRPEARRLLTSLAAEHLVEEVDREHFQVPGLLRSYAQERAD